MASVFTRIIKGEISSYKIAEDDKFYAFLDINPVQEGHTLVISKKEVDYFFDLDDESIGEMMVFAKGVAIKMKEKLKCRKVAMIVIGLEVAHAHIHLIPINSEGDIDFKNKLNLSAEQFLNMQKLLFHVKTVNK